MKSIRLVFAALAVVFAMTTAFTAATTETRKYFVPSGDVTEISGWQVKGLQAPGTCNDDDQPCEIYILVEEGTNNIDVDAFAALKSATSSFQVAQSSGDDVFTEKP